MQAFAKMREIIESNDIVDIIKHEHMEKNYLACAPVSIGDLTSALVNQG